MQNAAKRYCPFCRGELSPEVSKCLHCGRDLHAMKLAQSQVKTKTALYKVVPNGINFGIAVEGEVKIHGMDLKEAQALADLLNGIADIPKTG
jgi:hypothetical protein